MENQEEIWKDVVGYEGLYKVSNKGNIKTIERFCLNSIGYLRKHKSLTMKPPISKTTGYVRIGLCKDLKQKHQLVHRLVASAFLQNPLMKKYVNHINGIKTDNRVENLEWCTSSENRIHAIENGLAKAKGIESNMAKLTNEQVFKIRELSSQGVSHRKIVKEMGIVGKTAITDILSGKTWKHI